MAAGIAGGTLANRSDGVIIATKTAKDAVENNFLLNPYAEHQLTPKEKALFDKLKAHGVEDVDPYQEAFNKAKTLKERDDIIAQYQAAERRGSAIILSMYQSGELTEQEYQLLRTLFNKSLLEGAKKGQLANRGRSHARFWETDPYGFYGHHLAIVGTLQDPSLMKAEQLFVERQVQSGQMSKKEQETYIQRFDISAQTVSGISPDIGRAILDDPATMAINLAVGAVVGKAMSGGKVWSVKPQACSFHGDMEVKTEQGYKPIRSIKVGDKVYAKNALTKAMSYQRVQAHYSNPYDFTVYVDVMDAQGQSQTIVSNKIHPFFTKVNQGDIVPSSEGHRYHGEIENAQWIDAQHLKAGYQLLSENNQWQTVKGVRIRPEKLIAYNLTVETDHTYFIRGAKAEAKGVWVHNDCYISLPSNAKAIGEVNGYKAYTFTENGQKKTVIQTGERRFETLDTEKAINPVLNGSQTKIVKVDFEQTKTKNSVAHKTVNDLDVNTRYELSNGTKFKTNAHGYVEEISFKPANEKMPRTSQQTEVGKLGHPDDIGGHIQACIFGGTCDRYNLFPQNSNFNNSAYKTYFENMIKKAMKEGKTVDNVSIKFDRARADSPRPDQMKVTFDINGTKYTEVFKNQYGGGK